INWILYEPNMANPEPIDLDEVRLSKIISKHPKDLLNGKYNLANKSAPRFTINIEHLIKLREIFPNIQLLNCRQVKVSFELSSCLYSILAEDIYKQLLIEVWTWFWTSVVAKSNEKILLSFFSSNWQFLLDLLPNLCPNVPVL